MSGRLIALNRADVERTTLVNPDHIVTVDRPSETGLTFRCHTSRSPSSSRKRAGLGNLHRTISGISA